MGKRTIIIAIVLVVIGIVLFSLYFLSDRTSSTKNELLFIPELDFNTMSQLSPAYPLELLVESKDNKVLLKWSGTGGDIKHYQIYRKHFGEVWQQLDLVKPTYNNRGDYEYIDTTIRKGNTYIYGVSAVSIYGKESKITESHSISL